MKFSAVVSALLVASAAAFAPANTEVRDDMIYKKIKLLGQSFPTRIGCQALVVRAVPCREKDRRLVRYESKTHASLTFNSSVVYLLAC
jgi:hypothetical protein